MTRLISILTVPETAPEVTSVVRVNDTHMNVSWMALSLREARGFITGYIVRYEASNQLRKREANIEMAGQNDTFKVIGGLYFKSEYRVTVSGLTVAGEGIQSRETVMNGKNTA